MSADPMSADPMRLARSARLVAWGNSWLAGLAGLDDVLTAVQADDEPHVVVPPGEPGNEQPLAMALGQLRAAGVRRFQLALPVPGDVSTLPGPPAVNRAALEAGEVALADGCQPYALVPEVVAHGSDIDGFAYSVRWQLLPSERPRPLPASPRTAAAELAQAIHFATTALTRLDVAGARGEVLDDIARCRLAVSQEPGSTLPAGHPDVARMLQARCAWVRTLLDLADRDQGAAVTQQQVRERETVLRELATAVRRATEVACSSCEAVTGSVA